MKLLKKIHQKESGQAFILVLILLVVGALIITPLLGFMSTGLIAGQLNEKRMAELYAADAGVELALWQLRSEVLIVPADEEVSLDPFNMNDKTVNVTVKALLVGEDEPPTYKITSVATTDADSRTRVVSYVSSLDFSSFLDNAITSGGDVTIKPEGTPVDEVVEGKVEADYSGDWPSAAQLSAFYKSQVDTSDPYLAATWDVADNHFIGPLYRDGDLEIINTGTAGDSIKLEGTVYVTGRLLIGTTNKDFILDLNGQTIFVEDDSTKPQEAIVIGSNLTTSGVIIAVGDIDFQPKGSTDPNGFVFIMSVDGTVWFRPQGDFYGSIAGNVEVELWPGGTFTWDEPPDYLNFPTGSVADLEIVTWEIDPQ